MTTPTVPTLVTWYLEMSRRGEFIPSFVRMPEAVVKNLNPIDPDFYRTLYKGVGENYTWRDRLEMNDEELTAVLARADIHVLYIGEEWVGYVELIKSRATVSVEYFGLREEYQGRGLGKHLLSYGLARAWDMGAERIIVHTCNLDGTYALDNYKKRGFKVVRETEEPMPSEYT